jgi:hypothetical protein
MRDGFVILVIFSLFVSGKSQTHPDGCLSSSSIPNILSELTELPINNGYPYNTISKLVSLSNSLAWVAKNYGTPYWSAISVGFENEDSVTLWSINYYSKLILKFMSDCANPDDLHIAGCSNSAYAVAIRSTGVLGGDKRWTFVLNTTGYCKNLHHIF